MNDREKLIEQYCKAGFKILFTNNLKESVTRSWKENTTSDYDVIKEHMNKNPGHSIAVYTGASNLIIIDIDMKNGTDGNESLKKFIDEHNLYFPKTLSVKSPTGGRHLYYRCNKNDNRPRRGVIPGVDIRCGDSYAIIPPSKIENGTYEWEQEFVLENIADVNEDILWFCEYREEKKSPKKVSKKSKNGEVKKKQIVSVHQDPPKSKVIPAERIEVGSRNSELTALAGKLISQEMDTEEVEFYIKKANRERCNPPLSENEVNSLIKSALQNFVSCKKNSLELTNEEEIFLTDRLDIQKALEHLKRNVYVIQPDTEIEFKGNKDNITIYPCGTKKFNDVVILKLKEEGIKYSKLMWKAFKDKSILALNKALELDTVIQNIIDIESEDSGVLQIGGNILYEMNNCYFIDTEKNTRQISNFTMKLNEKIEIVNDEGTIEGGEFELEFFLSSGKHYKKRIAPSIFSSVRKFKELLKSDSLELSYMGTETDLEYIQQKMNKNVADITTKTGINYTGFYKTSEWNFVGTDKTLCANGYENEELISVVEPTGSITTDILKQKPICKNDLENLLPYLFGMNVTDKMIGILGWCVAVFCKERLRKMNSKFPHLIVCGEAGSGKSTMVEMVIQPLLSIKSQPLSCEKMTQFAVLKACSSTNFLPVVMEEFKPGRLQTTKLNLISSLLRDSFDFHSVRRGTITQKVNHFQYRAPIVLVGESGVSEKAINDRSIELLFSINERQQLHTNNFLWIKQHQSLLSEFGRSLLEFTLKMGDKDIWNILEEKHNYFEKNTEFEERNKLGLATVAMGMKLLKLFTESQGIDFEALTNINEQKVLDSLGGIQMLASSDGAGKTMTEIEKTIQVWDTMAKSGILVEGIHYQKQVASNELQLYIKEIYPLYSKYYRDFNLSMELDMIPKNFLTKGLKMTQCFKTHDKRIFHKAVMGNIVEVSTPKCFVLHLDVLEKEIEDLDKF